jgi:para-aminobenzoate synthetase component 1
LLIQQALPYTEDSAHWLARVRDLGQPVWLDSAWPHSRRGRYDIISAAPLLTLRDDSGGPPRGGDPFTAVKDQLAAIFAPLPTPAELPFAGGAIGLFGYDLGRRLHGLPPRPAALFPEFLVGLYSWCIVSDHRHRTTRLVMRPETPPPLRAELRRRVAGAEPPPGAPFLRTGPWREEFAASAYRQAFERLQQYIVAGDCYQVNLARRFAAPCSGDAWLAYRQLRAVAAAPFSAYLECDRGAVLCFSPERFLAAAHRRLRAQPIKGTAPRGADAESDRALADALCRSAKNRAENLMIVDLLRNDLGRSCKPGSIKVEQLFELQSFATVHHLVSSIDGELCDDLHPLDALRRCFPGGSITGAPKLRAMQIIDELEPQPRSLFCGSIGYMGCDGRMDTNIIIRTLLARAGEIFAWAGGGIVADSEWREELAETRDKIAPLLEALNASGES